MTNDLSKTNIFMLLSFRGIRGGGFMLFLILIGFSCQNSTSQIFGLNTNTSSFDMGDSDSITEEAKPLLLDSWDSLRRNQIAFTIDSLNPIPIKTQKRKMKDSLIKEFEKHPKHVFLTFDDGPLVGSFAIDSLAKAKNIKVSTFLVGRHAQMSKSRKKDLQRYIDNPLVACYNHSFTHGFNKFNHFYSDVQTSFADFEKNQEELQLKKKIARLPGRNIWIYDDVRTIDLNSGSQTADMLFANDYKVYGWDVEWRINSLTGVPVQSLNGTFQKMRNFLNNKSSQTPNNVVLLMHDDMFQTKNGRQLLANLIDSLKKENYQFEFMEDYPIKY